MVSTRIQLEEELYERLKSLAIERETSLSELMRQGIERLVGDFDRDRRWARLRRAIGSCCDSEEASDVDERHDEYLSDAMLVGIEITSPCQRSVLERRDFCLCSTDVGYPELEVKDEGAGGAGLGDCRGVRETDPKVK